MSRFMNCAVSATSLKRQSNYASITNRKHNYFVISPPYGFPCLHVQIRIINGILHTLRALLPHKTLG